MEEKAKKDEPSPGAEAAPKPMPQAKPSSAAAPPAGGYKGTKPDPKPSSRPKATAPTGPKAKRKPSFPKSLSAPSTEPDPDPDSNPSPRPTANRDLGQSPSSDASSDPSSPKSAGARPGTDVPPKPGAGAAAAGPGKQTPRSKFSKALAEARHQGSAGGSQQQRASEGVLPPMGNAAAQGRAQGWHKPSSEGSVLRLQEAICEAQVPLCLPSPLAPPPVSCCRAFVSPLLTPPPPPSPLPLSFFPSAPALPFAYLCLPLPSLTSSHPPRFPAPSYPPPTPRPLTQILPAPHGGKVVGCAEEQRMAGKLSSVSTAAGERPGKAAECPWRGFGGLLQRKSACSSRVPKMGRHQMGHITLAVLVSRGREGSRLGCSQ